MAARLPEPPAHAFVERRTVTEDDCDMLGHVGNVTWLDWVVKAAGAHSRSIGLDFDYFKRKGAVWIVRLHEIDYIRESRAGDELATHTWVAGAKAATTLRQTVIKRGDETLVATLSTWAFFDLNTRRPQRIPKDLLELYGWKP